MAGGAAFVVLVATSDYAHARVRAFLNPEGNPTLNYQVDRALDAFGAGGFYGTGLGTGTLKFRVPEVSTDFVFPAVGEELGLPVTLAVVKEASLASDPISTAPTEMTSSTQAGAPILVGEPSLPEAATLMIPLAFSFPNACDRALV